MTQAGLDDLWAGRLASGARQMTSSAIRDLLKVTEQPEMISFAGGLPAPECFPAEELALAAERVLATQAARALQYGPTEGYPPLRALVAALMRERGLPATPDQVLITNGSQQALDMIGKLLIDPGDPVLVEDPTYVGALQAWRPYRPRFVALPLDEAGLRIDALERALEDLGRVGQRPKFLYLVSCFQNPTGVTLAADRRAALIALAARHALPVIEDDPYGELRYSEAALPALAALDAARWGALRHVVYLSTFSKVLAPGLRVGWVLAPTPLQQQLVQAKQGLDLHSGSLAQAIAYEACRDGLLARQIARIRRVYCARRDAMLRALERTMPPGVDWTEPDGGMFLWVRLPPALDAGELLQRALERNVAFVPGAAFYANGGGAQTLRLNFSHATPARIEEGIARLAEAIADLQAVAASVNRAARPRRRRGR
jgi:2-aminoadipate transaminase